LPVESHAGAVNFPSLSRIRERTAAVPRSGRVRTRFRACPILGISLWGGSGGSTGGRTAMLTQVQARIFYAGDVRCAELGPREGPRSGVRCPEHGAATCVVGRGGWIDLGLARAGRDGVRRLAGGRQRQAQAGRGQVAAIGEEQQRPGDGDECRQRSLRRRGHVGRNGRYSLRLPPGKWALRTSTVTGGRYRSFLSAAIVTKPGQKRALPLTLRKFKKPRRGPGRHPKPRHPRRPPPSSHKSNVNPRDGRPYPGVAYALKEFAVSSSESEFRVLRRGMPDMLVTDLVASDACPFTIVEWIRRDEVFKELKLQQTERFDPATRVETGHLIDPDVFIRGRIEDRPGSPARHATIVWLEDARTGTRISNDVSVVAFNDAVFSAEQRLVKLILRDLICANAQPASGEGTPLPPPPIPVSNVYQGTFSGSAEAAEGGLQLHWQGNVKMDAAQDVSIAPPGGPPGAYRIFTTTTGSAHMDLVGSGGECALGGSGDFPLGPGNGYLSVQLDVDQPAYFLNISTFPILQVKESGGKECEDEYSIPVFGLLVETKEARSSPSTTLSDSESHSANEGTGYNYTTSWNLSPG
jgi:hypothetical protein